MAILWVCLLYTSKKSWVEEPVLVTEELLNQKQEFAWLHFGVQFHNWKKFYYIDYKELNDVVIWSWLFKSDYKEIGKEAKSHQSLNAEYVWYDTTLNSLRKDWHINFQYFSQQHLIAAIQKMKNDNTPEQHLSFLEKTRAMDTPNFIVKNRL